MTAKLMSTVHVEALTAIALELGYQAGEIDAGIDFSNRKARRTHPEGQFDNAMRFYAAERTEAVRTCRCPSRQWPYSEMQAARTAAHCAEVHGVVNVTHVRRLGLACDRLLDGAAQDVIRRQLKPGIRKRLAQK